MPLIVDRCHLFKQRFAAGDRNGSRSSEWVVVWGSRASDVYLATRTLGGLMKTSIHESGRCHIRAPDASKWRSPGPAPRFLDRWSIDPAAAFSYPCGVIIPETELRTGNWKKHKDKGTIWLPVKAREAIEVAILLVRTEGDCSSLLAAGGWSAPIVDSQLPDGRRLLVV